MTSSVFLKQLYIQGFRGIEKDLTIDLGRRLTIVAGGNATGKSSIVQAIRYTLTGEIADQYGKTIQNDYLRHLSSPTFGQIRLVLATESFGDGGHLSASTSESRSAIRNRASGQLVRDWTGSSEPPFTITHITSQELLADLLSPNTSLSRNNIASLFSGSYLRQMTKRAKELAEHSRRHAHGDNARSDMMKLTDRLQSAKTFRDGLAVTLELPSGAMKEIERQLSELAKASGLRVTGREALPILRETIQQTESRARQQIADSKAVGLLLVALAAAHKELALARDNISTLAAEQGQYRTKAEALTAAIDDLTKQEASARETLQNARRVIDANTWYELWHTRFGSLAQSLKDATTAVADLEARLSAAQSELEQSHARVSERTEGVIALDAQEREARSQIAAILECRELPIAGLVSELADADRQIALRRRELATKDAEIGTAREEAEDARALFEERSAALNAAAEAVLRASAAVEALAKLADGNECPLCGHDHGSMENLNSAIDAIRLRRSKARDTAQESANLAQVAAAGTRTRVEALSNQRILLVAETDGLERRQKEVAAALSSYQVRRREALTAVSLDAALSDAALDDKVAELQVTADRLAGESTNLATIRDQAQSIELGHAARIASLRAQLDQAVKNQAQVKAALDEHEVAKPGLVSPETLAAAQKHAHEGADALQQLQVRLATAGSEKSDTEQRLKLLEVPIAGLRETISQVEQRISRGKTELESHHLPEASAASLAVEEASAARVLAETSARLTQLATIEDYFANVDAAERLRAADDAVSVAAAELDKYQSSVVRFERFNHQFQALYDELLQRQNMLAESMLATTADPCRKLFHAMTAGCPWPLVFNLEDDRIVARLGTEPGAARAASILNAAYFNVAAVALRLALAAHQTWSHLRTAVFDDPILEMDNLTQAALIDGLESVLMSQDGPWSNLQLILTTWSEEFALMAAHKLAHLNEGTSDSFVVYQLQSDPSGSPIAKRFTPHWAKKTTAA